MSRNCNILFFPEGERYLYEMAPVINRLARTPGINVQLLISDESFQKSSSPDPYSQDELNNNIKFIDRPPVVNMGGAVVSAIEIWVSKRFGKRSDWLLNFFPIVILMAFLYTIDLTLERWRARKLIKDLQPDAFILTRDRNVGLSMAILRSMRKNNRWTFLVPWGFVNTSFAVANRFSSPRNILKGSIQSIVQKILSWSNSNQLIDYEGVRYSYFKPARYLAAIFTGLCPSNPWFFGSDVDYCLVDSKSTAVILTNNNVSESKLIVTGNQIHDTLYTTEEEKNKRKNSLREKYNYRKNKLLIIALPHLGEHKVMPWEQHWQEMHYLLKTITANSEGYDVLISLHPRSNRKDYEFLSKRYQTPILDEPLKTVLPVADAFICQWSGTTVWGVALNCPTLILNYYGIGSMGYEYLENKVVRVNHRDDLQDGVIKLINNPVAFSSDGLPLIDGHSTERVCSTIKSNVCNF